MIQDTKEEIRKRYQEHQAALANGEGVELMPSSGRSIRSVPVTFFDPATAASTPVCYDDDEYLDLTALPEPKPIKGDWLGAALTGLDAIASEGGEQ